jgi:hypothetical protein
LFEDELGQGGGFPDGQQADAYRLTVGVVDDLILLRVGAGSECFGDSTVNEQLTADATRLSVCSSGSKASVDLLLA